MWIQLTENLKKLWVFCREMKIKRDSRLAQFTTKDNLHQWLYDFNVR